MRTTLAGGEVVLVMLLGRESVGSVCRDRGALFGCGERLAVETRDEKSEILARVARHMTATILT